MAPGSTDGRLVDNRLDRCPSEAVAPPREVCQRALRCVRGKRHLLQPNVRQDDLEPAVGVRHLYTHDPVETPWPEQGLVQDLWPVCRGDHDHWPVCVPGAQTVHGGEELVERLLRFIASAQRLGGAPARAPNRVDLVDEDDARRELPCAIEKLADARRPTAHEELDELRCCDTDEREVRLRSARASEERLTCPWRPHKKEAARNARAEGGVQPRVVEDLDCFPNLGFGFLGTREVSECCPLDVLVRQPALLTGAIALDLPLQHDGDQQDGKHQDNAAQRGARIEKADEGRQKRRQGAPRFEPKPQCHERHDDGGRTLGDYAHRGGHWPRTLQLR
mmetsp:Transcript_15164/g.41584  ORF Transcript_15164/g.41584 Transcript_15164/m.41584 type:complete len:334 (+) Transcript_15164:407-1408(+)